MVSDDKYPACGCDNLRALVVGYIGISGFNFRNGILTIEVMGKDRNPFFLKSIDFI